jgi:hypothetical protein
MGNKLIMPCPRPKTIDLMNSFPTFKAAVEDEAGRVYDIHFAALFSHKSDAIPVVLLHGWPGENLISLSTNSAHF